MLTFNHFYTRVYFISFAAMVKRSFSLMRPLLKIVFNCADPADVINARNYKDIERLTNKVKMDSIAISEMAKAVSAWAKRMHERETSMRETMHSSEYKR